MTNAHEAASAIVNLFEDRITGWLGGRSVFCGQVVFVLHQVHSKEVSASRNLVMDKVMMDAMAKAGEVPPTVERSTELFSGYGAQAATSPKRSSESPTAMIAPTKPQP